MSLPFDIKDDLELALMGQVALLAYLAAIDAWFAVDRSGDAEATHEVYTAMYRAQGRAQRQCDHTGTTRTTQSSTWKDTSVYCQSCWRPVSKEGT